MSAYNYLNKDMIAHGSNVNPILNEDGSLRISCDIKTSVNKVLQGYFTTGVLSNRESTEIQLKFSS